MKKYLILIIGLHVSCGNNNNKPKEDPFTLQIGDLLFQDLDSSPLCGAIELVTPGYKGANLSHIGIIIENKIPFCTNSDSRFEEKYFYNIEQDVKVLEADYLFDVILYSVHQGYIERLLIEFLSVLLSVSFALLLHLKFLNFY